MPVLHKNDTVETLLKPVLIACHDDVTFRRRHNRRAVSHSVDSKWFEIVQVCMIRKVMCLWKPKAYCNEKEGSAPQNFCGYCSSIFCQDKEQDEAQVIRDVPSDAVLPNFNLELRRNVINN